MAITLPDSRQLSDETLEAFRLLALHVFKGAGRGMQGSWRGVTQWSEFSFLSSSDGWKVLP